MSELPITIYTFLRSGLTVVQDYKGGLKTLCPFHTEKTGSFFIFYSQKLDGWFYKCFGCRCSGSLSYLLKRLNGQALTGLISSPKLSSFSTGVTESVGWRPDSTLGYPTICDYFTARKIQPEISKRFSFKMDLRTPAAVMPIWTEHSYVGWVKRTLDPFLPRYIIEPGADFPGALWAWDEIDPTQPTIITEGIIDAATWWSKGYQAVALVGKKWESKLELLSALSRPVLLPDNGDPDSLDNFFQLSVRLCGQVLFVPAQFKDSNEWICSLNPSDEELRSFLNVG